MKKLIEIKGNFTFEDAKRYAEIQQAVNPNLKYSFHVDKSHKIYLKLYTKQGIDYYA